MVKNENISRYEKYLTTPIPENYLLERMKLKFIRLRFILKYYTYYIIYFSFKRGLLFMKMHYI